VPLISGFGFTPITLDLMVIRIFGVPISGIAGFGVVSARQIFHGDNKEVALAGFDNQLTLPALYNFATKGIVEVPVL
jgi:hypothetical protein